MVSPGSYTSVVILTIVRSIQAPAGSSEAVILNGTAPSGIGITFSPASPVKLTAGANLNVTITVTATASTAVGNDTISVQGVSGSYTQSASFSLRVVQYRVVMVQNTFIPSSLNITAGSTVYWQNIDGPAGGCGGGGSGPHNIVFTTLPAANSSSMSQFQIYSYTFTTPGSYFYYSSLNTDHSMNGTINVLATGGGGMGMVSRMPSFSYFRGGDPTVVTPTTPAARASSINPIGAMAAWLAFTGSLLLIVSQSALSGLGVEAGLAVVVSIAALALAFEVLTQGTRRMTAVLLAVVAA